MHPELKAIKAVMRVKAVGLKGADFKKEENLKYRRRLLMLEHESKVRGLDDKLNKLMKDVTEEF